MEQDMSDNTSAGVTVAGSDVNQGVAVGEPDPTTGGRRRRRFGGTRRPSEAKPIYLILRVKDAKGNPIDVSKDQVDVVGVERDAHKVLEQIDSGGSGDKSFYKRVMLPPIR